MRGTGQIEWFERVSPSVQEALNAKLMVHGLPTPESHKLAFRLSRRHRAIVRFVTPMPHMQNPRQEAGSFMPSRWFPRAEPAEVVVRPNMDAQTTFETLLHELGHVLDRELVGKGVFYASDGQGRSESAKCVAEISRLVKASPAFQFWQEREVAAWKLNKGWLGWFWRARPEQTKKSVNDLRDRYEFFHYYSNHREWFANLYMLEVVRRTKPAADYDRLVGLLIRQEEVLARFLNLDRKLICIRVTDPAALSRIQMLFDQLFQRVPSD